VVCSQGFGISGLWARLDRVGMGSRWEKGDETRSEPCIGARHGIIGRRWVVGKHTRGRLYAALYSNGGCADEGRKEYCIDRPSGLRLPSRQQTKGAFLDRLYDGVTNVECWI
jgi:hypothetical protein